MFVSKLSFLLLPILNSNDARLVVHLPDPDTRSDHVFCLRQKVYGLRGNVHTYYWKVLLASLARLSERPLAYIVSICESRIRNVISPYICVATARPLILLLLRIFPSSTDG